MNWKNLYYGHVSPEEVKVAVDDKEWQELRVSLKGLSTPEKYHKLLEYRNRKLDELQEIERRGINADRSRRMLQVQLTNYTTALSRGGLIKPSDYR